MGINNKISAGVISLNRIADPKSRGADCISTPAALNMIDKYPEERSFHFNAALTAVNLAKQDWLATKGKVDKPFSMSDYKTMYNNTLMLERFMCMFAINPNTPKNQKIVKELLDYGKIAA